MTMHELRQREGAFTQGTTGWLVTWTDGDLCFDAWTKVRDRRIVDREKRGDGNGQEGSI